MRKIISFILCASALCVSVLCGCAQQKSETPPVSDTPETELNSVCPASPAPSFSPKPSSAPKTEQEINSLDSKGIGWGFVRKKGEPPELSASQIKTLEDNGGYYLDHSGQKTLYLTFDEGYENGFTSKILDTLSIKKVSAAFFVTGPYLESQPELIGRMIDEGHIVGNHTVNHLNLPNQPVETVRSELDKLNKRCEELYGYTMKYMRPPEGEYSEKVLAAAKSMGYKTILWSMAYKDWDVNTQSGPQYAYEQVVPYLHSGAIILLHAVSSDNTAALGNIIDAARESGYEFKSLDDLCNQ